MIQMALENGPLIGACIPLLLFIAGIYALSNRNSLNGIKSRTVGDSQYGTARWATQKERRQSYSMTPYQPQKWRRGEKRPTKQGLVLGSIGSGKRLRAMVDSDDIHCLMIGASGVGKTAFFLYPNLEYACACGMIFLAPVVGVVTGADDCLGQNFSVPLRLGSRGQILRVIPASIHIAVDQSQKIVSIGAGGIAQVNDRYALSVVFFRNGSVVPRQVSLRNGQNAYFYDAAKGLLTSVILMLAEYFPPSRTERTECRHILSVFKLVQELLEPSQVRGRNRFQLLMDRLPPEHKASWFAGAVLNAADQAMASVMSTILSRLNAFLASGLEQVLCFDSAMDTEVFAKEKCAIFLILPEDATKNFMAGLMIQNLSRELFTVADENGGTLPNRVVLFCDELGTMPPFDLLPLFSAGRSRKLTLVPIIQSLAQLEKNYGKEGAEIILDNCQNTIFGGFAPNSQTAEMLSKALGTRTGAVRLGKQGKGRQQLVPPDDRAAPDDAGRAESAPKGPIYRHENWHAPGSD